MNLSATVVTRVLAMVLVLMRPGAASAQGALQDDLRAQFSARLEREPFPTASAIKVPILYELLKRADEGRLPLDAPQPLNRSQSWPARGCFSTSRRRRCRCATTRR